LSSAFSMNDNDYALTYSPEMRELRSLIKDSGCHRHTPEQLTRLREKNMVVAARAPAARAAAKAARAPAVRRSAQHTCRTCGATETPHWRKGTRPDGDACYLCNACALAAARSLVKGKGRGTYSMAAHAAWRKGKGNGI
jgi:hypothetical protein